MTERVPSLAEVERLIWKLLRTPEGPARGVEALAEAGELQHGDLERWIGGDERLDAAGRVNVYANMYFVRQKDALKSDFPKCAAILGEEGWHQVFSEYLLDHPSTHYSLRFLGRAFPGFLATHRVLDEAPFLADLAAFEWALSEALQAEDSPVLSGDDLAGVPAERWGDLVFTAVPAVALLDLGWDVTPLWEDLDARPAPAEGDEGEPADTGEVSARNHSVLVHRVGVVPRHAALPPDEAVALRALLRGKTFGEICESLAASEAEIDAAASRAAEFLLGWVGKGVLSAYGLEDSPT